MSPFGLFASVTPALSIQMEIKDQGMNISPKALDSIATQEEKASVSSLIHYKSQEGKNIVYLFLFCPHR